MARSRPRRRAAATPDASLQEATAGRRPWPVAVAAVCAAALAVRLVLLSQLHGHPLLQPTGVLDDAEYLRLAQRAAGGDWALGPGAYYVSPLYIYFLAAVFRLAGVATLPAQILQGSLGAAAAGLVAVTGRRLFGARAGVIAGAAGGRDRRLRVRRDPDPPVRPRPVPGGARSRAPLGGARTSGRRTVPGGGRGVRPARAQPAERAGRVRGRRSGGAASPIARGAPSATPSRWPRASCSCCRRSRSATAP